MAASPLPHPAAVHADQAGHQLPGSAQSAGLIRFRGRAAHTRIEIRGDGCGRGQGHMRPVSVRTGAPAPFRLRPARAGGVTLSVGSVLRPAGMPSVGLSSLRLERLGCQARSLLSGAIFRVRMCCQAVGRFADLFVLKVAA